MKSNDEKAYQVDEIKKHYNEKQLSRSVMIDVFFNDINVIKYDVVFFTCQHCFISQLFDNKNELKDYVLNIYQFDIRFFEVVRRLQQTSKNEHAKKHVYNFFSLFFMNYAIIQASIFD